jgi:hypothetical protein
MHLVIGLFKILLKPGVDGTIYYPAIRLETESAFRGRLI